MPQGGFSRDFHSAAMLKAAAQKERDKQERQKIGNEVIDEISQRLDDEVSRIEENIIQKNEESFIVLADSIKARDRMLKFLAWGLFISLVGNSFMLGYFL
jgi:hypothetical protein